TRESVRLLLTKNHPVSSRSPGKYASSRPQHRARRQPYWAPSVVSTEYKAKLNTIWVIQYPCNMNAMGPSRLQLKSTKFHDINDDRLDLDSRVSL
ncbi:hypothetical protein SFRURICE_008668, partial [Spodoptera frugiperda]